MNAFLPSSLGMVKALARTFLLLATLGGISVRAQSVLVKNIVLVHGAWADGSGWKGVYDILLKDGFNVSIVQEPETSFKDDVAATKRVLARQEGPCILVAHSNKEDAGRFHLYRSGTMP